MFDATVENWQKKYEIAVKHAQAVVLAVSTQRNNALNDAAQLAATVTELQDELKRLQSLHDALSTKRAES